MDCISPSAETSVTVRLLRDDRFSIYSIKCYTCVSARSASSRDAERSASYDA